MEFNSQQNPFICDRILSGYAPSTYINRIESANKVSPSDLDKYLTSHLIDKACIRSLAQRFGRTEAAICKQIEQRRGWFWASKKE